MDISTDIDTIMIDNANVIVMNQEGPASITSTSKELEKYVTINKQGSTLYVTIDSTYNDNKPSTYPMKMNVANIKTCHIELQKGQLDAAAICPNSTSYIVHSGILIADIPTTYYNKLNISVDSGTINIKEYVRAENGALLKKYPELESLGNHNFTLDGQTPVGGNIWSVHVDKGTIMVRGSK